MLQELEERFESDGVRIAVLRESFLMDATKDSILVNEMDFKISNLCYLLLLIARN